MTPTATQTLGVVDGAVPADWLRVGRSTTVRVSVRNPGDQRTVQFEVTHDGAMVSTHAVTLRPNSEAVYELEVAFSEPVNGQVAVDGVVVGELTVAAASEPTSTGSETGSSGGSGPAVVLVVSLALAVWLGARRRSGGP